MKSVFINEKVDKNVPIYRYVQVKTKIMQAISSGHYKKGEKLPSEKELSKQLGISLITTRRALAELCAEEIIVKEWGKGIYVQKVPSVDSSTTKTVALTVLKGEEYLQHPAVISLLYGVGDMCKKRGYSLEIIFITNEMIQKKDYSDLEKGHIQGVIAAVQEIPAEDLTRIKENVAEMIIISRSILEPNILFDFSQAIDQIMNHLFELGHRRIALLGGLENTEVFKCIRKTYIEFLSKNNISIDEMLIRNGPYTHQSGYELGLKIMKTTNASAIITGDDNIAMGVLEAVRMQGLNCPSDISICSFNDFPWAAVSNPPLTTVRVPYNEIGKIAANNLIDKIEGMQIKPTMTMTGKLIIRESTAPVCSE